MVFIGQPLPVKLATTSAFAAFASVCYFSVWTKHSDVQTLDPSLEPLFRSSFYKQYNPKANPSTNDVVIRRIPLAHIRPDLLDDARNGGGALVEAFCAGAFGGKFFALQRLIHSRNRPPAAETSALIQSLSTASESSKGHSLSPQSQSSPSLLSSLWPFSSSQSTPPTPSPPASEPLPTATELWTSNALETSSIPTSTIITNHFLVLSRSPPNSILLRCGDSPLTNPLAPRASDGLFELSATPDFERGYAEFTMKSVFYDGTKELSPKQQQTVKEGQGQTLRPMQGTMEWLHWQYAKGMMESGVSAVRMSKFLSMDKQTQRIREQQREKEEAKQREIEEGQKA